MLMQRITIVAHFLVFLLQIYKHLEESLFSDPETFKVPEWWNEVYTIKSKL